MSINQFFRVRNEKKTFSFLTHPITHTYLLEIINQISKIAVERAEQFMNFVVAVILQKKKFIVLFCMQTVAAQIFLCIRFFQRQYCKFRFRMLSVAMSYLLCQVNSAAPIKWGKNYY